MTAREWAQKHWEVVKAYGEGKKIQWFDSDQEKWIVTELPSWNDLLSYHIKPEPKMVPYDPEDAVFLVGRKAKSKLTNSIYLILGFDGERAEFVNSWSTFQQLLDNYLDVTDTPDGVPFGKVVE